MRLRRALLDRPRLPPCLACASTSPTTARVRRMGPQPTQRTVQGVLEEALAHGLPRDAPVPPDRCGPHRRGCARDRAGRAPRRHRRAARDPDPAPRSPPSARTGRRGRPSAQRDRRTQIRRDRAASASAPPADSMRGSHPLWRRYEYRIADATAPRNPLTRLYTPGTPTTRRSRDEHRRARAARPARLGGVLPPARGRDDHPCSCRRSRWTRDDDGVLTARPAGRRVLPQHGAGAGGRGDRRDRGGASLPEGRMRRHPLGCRRAHERVQGDAGARAHPHRGGLPAGRGARRAARSRRAIGATPTPRPSSSALRPVEWRREATRSGLRLADDRRRRVLAPFPGQLTARDPISPGFRAETLPNLSFGAGFRADTSDPGLRAGPDLTRWPTFGTRAGAAR